MPLHNISALSGIFRIVAVSKFIYKKEGAKMNDNEVRQLCKQLKGIGVQNVGQLAALLKKHGIHGNGNIINFVNELYIQMEV